MEMLGRDSTSFRIDLQCAERIAKYSDGQTRKEGLSCIVMYVFASIIDFYRRISIQLAQTTRHVLADINYHFCVCILLQTAFQFYKLLKSQNVSSAKSLLSQLELATQAMIASSGIEMSVFKSVLALLDAILMCFFCSCGLEAEECWELVQSFCHYHQLPPSVAFLTVCADNGQWLPLLCNAQLHSIAPQRVCDTAPAIETHPQTQHQQ